MKDDCLKYVSSTWNTTFCLFPQNVQNSVSSLLCSGSFLRGVLISMQKVQVNCHRNSKHTVPFRSRKTFPQENNLAFQVSLCIEPVAGVCTLHWHSQKGRNELDYLHEWNLSWQLGTVSQLLHRMLGKILFLGIVILGKARGSRGSRRRLALLVLYSSKASV